MSATARILAAVQMRRALRPGINPGEWVAFDPQWDIDAHPSGPGENNFDCGNGAADFADTVTFTQDSVTYGDRLDRLAIAGALVAAEIDRLLGQTTEGDTLTLIRAAFQRMTDRRSVADLLTLGELADAGSCYCLSPDHHTDERRRSRWPFPIAEWSPDADRVRELAVAGAFIGIEIERIERAG